MHKFLIIALLFTTSLSLAQDMSEDNKHVLCGDGRAMLKSLKEQHNETPTVLAVGSDSNIVIVVNHNTGAWTALETRGQKTMCVLGTGSKFKLDEKLFTNN